MKKEEIKKALNTIKTYLGMEVKLEQMMLADGVTSLEADAFEPGMPVMIVNEEDRIPLPIGDYELEDGRILKVVEEGVIGSIEDAPVEEEQTSVTEQPSATEQPEAEVEVEMEQSQPVKKTVESTVKETYFSKEEVEELKSKITELEAKIVELSKVEKVKEEVNVELEEVKPIQFNPENAQPIQITKIGKGGDRISQILETIYK